MGFPSVNIVQLSGSGNRPSTNQDYISGMIFYGTAPVVTGKWATQTGTPSIKYQQMFSTADATSAGIVPYSDNTAASGAIEVGNGSSLGTIVAGDIITITCAIPTTSGTLNVVLCAYTTVSGDISDTTGDTLAASLKAAINGNTSITGFSGGTITSNSLVLNAPQSTGIALNSDSSLTVSANNGHTFTNTITDFTGGTASQWAIWFYQISEFFRVFPSGSSIWVGVISATSSYLEMNTLQISAGYSIRQVGIQEVSGTNSSAANMLTTMETIFNAEQVLDNNNPYVVIWSPNIEAISDLSTLPNTNTASPYSQIVQCCISQDGNAAGAQLYINSGQSIGNMGVKLATLAQSRVSASDAQIQPQFNVSGTPATNPPIFTGLVENNIPAFSNGKLSSQVSINLQTQLQNYNYTFFRTWGQNAVGTYWSDNRMCTSNSSNYAYMNDNRTVQKIKRIVYGTYIVLLSSEIIFNSDGTLSNPTLETWINAGNNAITANMVTGYGSMPLCGTPSGGFISISPNQNIQSTGFLVVNVSYIQNGIARNITINVSPTSAA